MLIDAKNIMLIPLSVVHLVPYSTMCVNCEKRKDFQTVFCCKAKIATCSICLVSVERIPFLLFMATCELVAENSSSSF